MADAAWAPTEWQGRAKAAPPPEPASAGSAQPLGTRLGEYERMKVPGQGGFGIAYLAQDHMLERRVAIEEYMPAMPAWRGPSWQLQAAHDQQRTVYDAGLAGFVHAARRLARFDHPALVNVPRFWQGNGTAYMVMPFYQGITPKQALQATGKPLDEAWLTELLDLGVARQVIGDATQALTAILKPGYAPIEQYGQTAALRQGPWTDVYALCGVVDSAITGHNPPAAAGRTVNDSHSLLIQCAAGQYSDRQPRAIDHGLRLKPNERPVSTSALRRELGLDVATAASPAVTFEATLAQARPAATAAADPAGQPACNGTEVARQSPIHSTLVRCPDSRWCAAGRVGCQPSDGRPRRRPQICSPSGHGGASWRCRPPCWLPS